MRRTGLILLIAAALATPFFLGTGFAQGWGGGTHGGMMGNGYGMMGNGRGMMNGQGLSQNVPEKYQLSDTQQEKIQGIRDSYFDKIQSLQNQLRAKQQQYDAALRNNANTETLNARRNAIQNLWDQIGEYRLDARKQVNQVLTADQLAYYGSGHHFLMGVGMYGHGSMMYGSTNGYTGCFDVNSTPRGRQSQTGPRGMMNQN